MVKVNKIAELRYHNKWIKKLKKVLMALIYRAGNLIFFYRRKEFRIPPEEIRRVLFISLYFRGDVLFHTPVIKMLKLYFNNAGIDVWVKSRSREVLENNPDVIDIIVFDGVETDEGSTNAIATLKGKREFIKRLKKNEYDLVVDYTGLFFTGLVSCLLKPRFSMGKFEQRFGFFYNKFIDLDLSSIGGHLISKYLNLLQEGLSIPAERWRELSGAVPPKGIIYVTEEDKRVTEAILIDRKYDLNKPLLTLHLTAGWEAKRWSIENYRDLIVEIMRMNKYEIAVVGSKFDRNEFSKISEAVHRFSGKQEQLSVFFELPLKLNAALIQRSAVFIGSDSLPLHIAGAMGTRSIGIFGPTNPLFSNPVGDIHRIIYHELECSSHADLQYCTRNAGKTCKTIDCIKMVAVKEIMQVVDKLAFNGSG